jgi:hypothetical protein
MSTLIWGVRSSFVAYVSNQSDASIHVGDGAWITKSGFAFAGAEQSDELMTFRGTVIFRAHGGLLHVELRDPQIRRHGRSWVLSVKDGANPSQQVDFALVERLEAVKEPSLLRASNTALLPGVVPLFGGSYQAGTLLDDPVVSLVDTEPPGTS